MIGSTQSSSIWLHPEAIFDDPLWSTTQNMFPSFEHMGAVLSVQSLEDVGASTAIHSLCQMSNDVTSAQVDSSPAIYYLGPFNSEELAQLDASFRQPNRASVGLEIEKDDTNELVQLNSHFEQPNVETDQVEHSDDIARCGRQLFIREATNGESNLLCGATTTNLQIIDSKKNKAKERIVKDYGITRETLEQHFGMTLEDAAKSLHVSRSTLKRICKAYGISRWPHHKTRKVDHHVS
ncbi:protein NLP3-like [Lycium ferocissimum]|uniref:protein NLP3-like n=1 Tax=Lycium ferocissimum TaxID=112874 RepID=UPI002816898A|nr:protein NLP3-like [Lycium ferocissimum]XP_059311412.1 protein NLP3-like [Lycium ferocissimum]